MRHHKKKLKINRDKAHRKALIRNLVISFFKYGKISTTETKAKRVKPYIEKLITLGKKNNLHARRLIIKKINNIGTAEKIIKDVSPMFKDINGGYLKIIKINTRKGDGATNVMIKYVINNDSEKKKTI
ncbi:50S ribosomal protein L17 [Patescibacteria group bacterium]|nr:50S ribosomal protein L17 [Patescibacteria group bacterium]MBU0963641.1 50S ribosomal protein L17 [Patescibacteria group bacterium]